MSESCTSFALITIGRRDRHRLPPWTTSLWQVQLLPFATLCKTPAFTRFLTTEHCRSSTRSPLYYLYHAKVIRRNDLTGYGRKITVKIKDSGEHAELPNVEARYRALVEQIPAVLFIRVGFPTRRREVARNAVALPQPSLRDFR